MFTKRPHILITNDDGINALGIRHLWKSLVPHADITVVAPFGEQSSVSLSSTLRQPLRIEKAYWGEDVTNIWSVSGTPVDCIKLALNAILPCRPDLVVSGINRGGNLGKGVLYSGTVAAAIESIMQEIPAVAFSCQDYHIQPDYLRASQYVPYIINYVLEHPLPNGTLLNVNFPEKQFGDYKGFKMTSQGSDWWAEDPNKREHPDEGHSYYWLGAKLRRGKIVEDGEDTWLNRGYITAVPVQVVDLTDRQHLETSKMHFEGLFPSLTH